MLDCMKKSTKIIHKVRVFGKEEIKNNLQSFCEMGLSFCSN